MNPELKEKFKSALRTKGWGWAIDNKQGDHFGGGVSGGAGTAGTWNDSKLFNNDWVRTTPIPIIDNFTDAYTRAKQGGLKEFTWKGKIIPVVNDPNVKYKPKEYDEVLLKKREVLDKDLKVNPDSTSYGIYMGDHICKKEILNYKMVVIYN